MAQKLGEMLVFQGLISKDQLTQALSAQGQLGGRLGSNLVEMGFITESQLASVLSLQLNIPFVQSSEVGQIPKEVIAKIPAEIAQEYRAIPFKLENRTLCVCMCDPNDIEKLDELSFRIGQTVKPYVITEVALNYAMERYYGLPKQARFLKLSGAVPTAATFIHLANAGDVAGGDESVIKRSDFFDPTASALTTQTSSKSSLAPDLRLDLANAQKIEQVLHSISSYLSSIFRQGLILSVEQTALWGLSGFGLGIAPNDLKRLKFELAEDSVLHEAIANMRIVVREETSDQLLRSICSTVSITPNFLTLLPFLENRKVALLAIGHGATAEHIKQTSTGIMSFVSQVSCALQILTLRGNILGSANE